MVPDSTQAQIDAIADIIAARNSFFEEPIIAGLITEAKEGADIAVLAIEDFNYETARQAAIFALTNFIAGNRLIIQAAQE